MARLELKSVAPLAYAPVLAMETYARRHMDKPTLHLIKIRASALNGCSYCSAMHTRDAAAAGESQARIDALAGDWAASGLFDEKESAALAYTDALTRLGDDGVGADLYEATAAQWGEKGVAHLVMAIATINTWNRVAIGTGMTAADLT